MEVGLSAFHALYFPWIFFLFFVVINQMMLYATTIFSRPSNPRIWYAGFLVALMVYWFVRAGECFQPILIKSRSGDWIMSRGFIHLVFFTPALIAVIYPRPLSGDASLGDISWSLFDMEFSQIHRISFNPIFLKFLISEVRMPFLLDFFKGFLWIM